MTDNQSSAEKPAVAPVESRAASTSGKAKISKGAAPATGAKAAAPKRPDGWRETVEAVVVAFVLAFLFRTFEAEAFVIPTGSMAPTLYGQHRDVYCEECGTRFAVGVSSLPSSDAELREDKDGYYIVHDYRTKYAVCPNANCRYLNNVLDHEIFAGDRILVNKFPYEFHEPERWDVVVFKFPEGAKTNYIKRLIGLPGEEVMLQGGDVWFRPAGTKEAYRIARKAPEKQRQLQLPVHDNDRPARELLDAGWPEAWAPLDNNRWSPDPQARSFRADPGPDASEEWDWLRYSHYLPSAADWDAVRDGRPFSPPDPQFITDNYAYNSRISVNENLVRGDEPNPQWVGDLTLSCAVDVLAQQGSILLELVEGARRYRCEIDLQTGRGKFSYPHEMNREEEEPQYVGGEFDTGMKSKGEYEISFANVDDRLCLWVDDTLVKSVEFEVDETLRKEYQAQRQPIHPGELDKTPVGIAARGANVRVSHLKIERDTYYRNDSAPGRPASVSYPLKDSTDDSEDEFLMLGDNSPKSNDSRLWLSGHGVPRRLLIGKAFFIYWPHGVPFLNSGRGFPVAGKYSERPDPNGRVRGPSIPKFSLPFYPQVGRMHRIR